MSVLPPGRQERLALILLVLGLAIFLASGCSAVGALEETGGDNPWGLPWWAWLLIGIAGALLLL